ncbi:MAG: adenosylmethionine decarboxylase [archaeon]
MIVKEVIADFYGVKFELLNNEKFLKKICIESVNNTKAKIVNKLIHCYKPQGVSVVLLLAESHLLFYTYPELGYASCSVLLCNDKMNAMEVITDLEKFLKPTKTITKKVPHKMPEIKETRKQKKD